uniref:Variant surface glycoprotein 1125.2815 n=1 Tax=Trypanosoma brucei TaxID=5691 RepID=A0A1J0R8S5_9TRYP|nr:variant surface glycoprotein 1125.2815 [Trypanosoma brucei]
MQLLDNSLEGARQAVRAASGSLQKNIHTANLWLHESAKQKGKKAAAFAILAAYAGTTNAADTKSLKTKQTELDKLADIINRQIGATAAMHTIASANFGRPLNVITGATGETTHVTAKSEDITLNPVQLTKLACRTERDGKLEVNGERSAETLSQKIAISQASKYAALQTTTKPKLTCKQGNGGAQTVKWTSSAAKMRGCSTTSDNAVILLDLSTYKLLDDPKPELVTLNTGSNSDQCHPTTDKEKETMPADTDVLGAICELEKLKTIAVKDLEQTTLSELQQSPEVQGALAILYGKDSIGSSNLEKTVKLLFETPNKNF